MALAKRIIPCLDVDRGRVVKGVNFVGIRDAGDPVEIARRYSGNIGQLEASARHMTRWAKVRLGMQNSLFIDHSGLSAASRVTPNDMVGALQKALLIWPEFPKLMKKIKPRDARGNLDRASGALILAKTGTLHYVSALAGYVTEGVVRPYAFAIFCQDLEQRQKLFASVRETSRNARY